MQWENLKETENAALGASLSMSALLLFLLQEQSSHPTFSPRDPVAGMNSAPTIGISNCRDAPVLRVTANRGRPDPRPPGIILA